VFEPIARRLGVSIRAVVTLHDRGIGRLRRLVRAKGWTADGA